MRGNVHVRFGGRVRRNGVRETGPPRSAPTLHLSYDSRAADLLFEVVSRRHEQRPILLTTNKPFAEWNEVFPNSSSVTALVDRLLHHAEIVKIEGESYRAKEAKERATEKARQRAARRKNRTAARPSAARGKTGTATRQNAAGA